MRELWESTDIEVEVEQGGDDAGMDIGNESGDPE